MQVLISAGALVNPADEFDVLKASFGEADDADKLSLEEFVAMSDTRANSLWDNVLNHKIAGRLSLLRHQAKSHQQQQGEWLFNDIAFFHWFNCIYHGYHIVLLIIC